MSGRTTELNGIQPQQNEAVYARALGNGEGDQLLPESNPYHPYLLKHFAQQQSQHQQQQVTPSLAGSPLGMNTPPEPRRAKQWPSPKAGHDNHTSGHGYNPSTGRFEPDRSLGYDATFPVLRHRKTLERQSTGEVSGESSNRQSLNPQQRLRASTGAVQYDNQQNLLRPQFQKPSNTIASGGNHSLDQSKARRPSGSNAFGNTTAAQPQQVSVGQTPLNDIQQVQNRYNMYAQQFYTLTESQRNEMKVLRGIIVAHEKSGSGRSLNTGRGATRDSRRHIQNRQRQPQQLSRPAGKRNVGHVDVSSDAEGHSTARPQAKKARQSLHGNEDTAMYEGSPGRSAAMSAANQRGGVMKSTNLVGPRNSVQRWVDEQIEQTNTMPTLAQEGVDPAEQQSDSSSVPDVRPLRVQHHRDGSRTEHFHLRPQQTMIPQPFGRLAHFVPPDTILMVVSPDDDCGYVCPSGSTEAGTRTYMSLAAAQLGMMTAYQVKSMQEAMVPLQHIKVAVYDDRIGFQKPTAGISIEGRVSSLVSHVERTVEPPNDDEEGSRVPAASSSAEARAPDVVQQPSSTPKPGNRTPMTAAKQPNSNPGTSQKSAPIHPTSLDPDGSKQQESSAAAANSQADQPAHVKHSHPQTPRTTASGNSANEKAIPKSQSHASTSNSDRDTQFYTNKDQSSSDGQELHGSASLPQPHPASDPTFLDGAYDMESMNYGQAAALPQSDAEHSQMPHSLSGSFSDMLTKDWPDCPMPIEMLNQDPRIAGAAGTSALETNMQPTDAVQHANASTSVWDQPLLQENDEIFAGLDFDMDCDMDS
ncbi:hypothetical protein G7Y79_00021g049910 [Physcia stellaris]|nr:hypothetical protein G7Y79_00021g049910 [Physcia stellaris]